jgi:hypothetical protein
MELISLRLFDRYSCTITALRKFGELDALAHKPLKAFYDIPNIVHNDEEREQYETGYRSAAIELFLEGH